MAHSKITDRRLVRFALVGASSTAISLGGYAVLLAVGTPYLLAGLVAYALGILNGYTWNRLWTFESGAAVRAEFARYASVQVTAALANVAGLAVAVELLGFAEFPAELGVLTVLVLATYAINRSWTFRRDPPANLPPSGP